MGRHDAGGDCIWCFKRDNSGGNAGRAGFCQGGGNTVHYHAWHSLLLDGTDADCRGSRTYREADRMHSPGTALAVSEDTERASGYGADCGELYCEHPGPRLGGNAGGLEGHGGA